jgi:enterochelin esterase-like enzyme/RNAse (barnase) inhibitor barstar
MFMQPVSTIFKTMPFYSYFDFKESLYSVASLRDAELRRDLSDALWDALSRTNQIPFRLNFRTAFLYRGEARSVAWNGDFNAWGSAKTIPNVGERVGKTTIRILEKELPRDARLDYKVVADGNWILDPENPHTCKSGFGKSSELRMPDYVFPDETLYRDGVPKGFLEPLMIDSKHLGYAVSGMIYTPHHYKKLTKLPVIYATDGHEYLDDEQGALRVALDNMIASGKINPVMCVFVSPLNPMNPGENRRLKEYPMNESFGKFFTEELIPKIDATYKTERSPDARLVLGTSMGGLCAGYLGAAFHHHIHLLAIQSAAFWNKPELYTLYKKAYKLPLKIYMSNGTLHDGLQKNREMKDIFIQNRYQLLYREVSESHSWGNWRGRLPEMLSYFFSSSPGQVVHEVEAFNPYPKEKLLPAKSFLKIPVSAELDRATMKVYDMYGKEIQTVFENRRVKNFFSVSCQELELKQGLYFYRLVGRDFAKAKFISVR